MGHCFDDYVIVGAAALVADSGFQKGFFPGCLHPVKDLSYDILSGKKAA